MFLTSRLTPAKDDPRCIDFTYLKGKIIFDVLLDSIKHKALLNTGTYSSSIHIVIPPTSQSKNRTKAVSGYFNLREPDFKEVEVDADLRCFFSEHQRFASIGLNEIYNNRGVHHLCFEKQRICFYSNDVPHDLYNNFSEVKSKFSDKGLILYITIRKKQYQVIFDTSYNGTFLLPLNSKLPFYSDFNFKYEVRTKDTDHIEILYPNKSIKFNEFNYNASIVLADTKTGRVGLNFLRAFDWLIDTKNRKVFARKNTICIDEKYQTNVTLPIMHKLYVIRKVQSLTQIKLGDEIQSVGGVKVGAENICYLFELLNNTRDWNKLNLVVERPSKDLQIN
ncbi:MAG TPA: hypothetical protein VGB50_08270 [Flavobacterium sp.]